MCNLYSIEIGQQAIRDIAKAMRDMIGNMPSLPGVFPDYFASRAGQRPRADDGALGHAVPGVCLGRQEKRPRRHEHSQSILATLAPLAWYCEPLRLAVYGLF
jgi:hypothetical protein